LEGTTSDTANRRRVYQISKSKNCKVATGEDHENVTPANVYFAKKDGILSRRKEAKQRILRARKKHNQKLDGS
jgi:hypothetical protein